MQFSDRLIRGGAIQSFLAEATDSQIAWQLMLIAAVVVLTLLMSSMVRR